MNSEIQISDLTHDGRGVGRQQGKACFVEGALPGERVDWKLTKSHRQYDEGITTSVISASPERIEPGCRYFGDCGGCQIQHLNYSAQVRAKQKKFENSLAHKNISVEKWLEPICSNPWSYRRRARLSVAQLRGKKEQQSGIGISIGFKKRNSNQVLEIENCPVLVEELNLLLPKLSLLLESISTTQLKTLSEIELSYDLGRLSICFIGQGKSIWQSLEKVPAEFEGCDIWHRPKAQEARLIYSQDEAMAQPASTGFMQANAEVNDALVEKAGELLELSQEDVLLDMFSGSGNFSTHLASSAGEVLGLESDQMAVDRANAIAHQIPHLNHLYADLFDEQALAKLRPLFRKASAVILDPPRAGAEEVIKELVKPKPAQILYVSCHPATFIRDAEILVSRGYKLQAAGLLDMFPQTMHAEVIGHFRI